MIFVFAGSKYSREFFNLKVQKKKNPQHIKPQEMVEGI